MRKRWRIKARAFLTAAVILVASESATGVARDQVQLPRDAAQPTTSDVRLPTVSIDVRTRRFAGDRGGPPPAPPRSR